MIEAILFSLAFALVNAADFHSTLIAKGKGYGEMNVLFQDANGQFDFRRGVIGKAFYQLLLLFVLVVMSPHWAGEILGAIWIGVVGYVAYRNYKIVGTLDELKAKAIGLIRR